MSQRHHESNQDQPDPNDIEPSASSMAEQLCKGFIYHDQREREQAIEAFAAVDSYQFAHIDDDAAHRAAVGYVDALWAKDEIEESCRVNGELDPEALQAADWSAMTAAFERRAAAAEIDPRYAELTTEAWINHKTGGDYWTATMQAQMLELRAVFQDQTYPHKSRYGQSGFGPEAARYVAGIEYHDTRRWEEAREVMIPYFQYILNERDNA